jgi:hypothetical protein
MTIAHIFAGAIAMDSLPQSAPAIPPAPALPVAPKPRLSLWLAISAACLAIGFGAGWAAKPQPKPNVTVEEKKPAEVETTEGVDDALAAYRKYEGKLQRHKLGRDPDTLFGKLKGIPKDQAVSVIKKEYERLNKEAHELQTMEAKHAIQWGKMGLKFSPTHDVGPGPDPDTVQTFWKAENRD